MSRTSTTAAATLLMLAAGAQADGYLVDSTGNPVRNSAGECWHTNSWDPKDAVIGCDGNLPPVAVAPKPEPVVVAVVEPVAEQVTLDAETYFAFDQAQLKETAIGQLDAVVAKLQGYNDLVGVRIEGHADPIGDQEYNQRLAMARAQAVKDYLVDKGRLDPDLLTLVSMGESVPVVQCEEQRGQALMECLAPNRRVELLISAIEVR